MRGSQQFALASCVAVLAAFSVIFTEYRTNAREELCEGFIPPNDLNIPVRGKLFSSLSNRFLGGISEEQFNAAIDRFERLYRDEFAKAGGTLVVNRYWDQGVVNAFAGQRGSTWFVDMYGGLARHPSMTADGFALVLCHEAGHHLGGAPKTYDRGWAATNEGGSDYYATLKCLRRFFAEDDNAAVIAKAAVDPLVKERCERQFAQASEQLICQRTSLAGADVGQFFADIYREQGPPSVSKPDPSVVAKTFNKHPKSQCRLDTYFSGAVCHVDVSIPVSDQDYREGACVQARDEVGFRPLCWFKPD